MKSHKATQTNAAPIVAFGRKQSLLDNDPLSISCANVVSLVRGIEAQLMQAIGLQRRSVAASAGEYDPSKGQRIVRGYEQYILETSNNNCVGGGSKRDYEAQHDAGVFFSSFGVQDEEIVASAAIVTEEIVDDFVRHRIASLTASIIRQAEVQIVEELTRITQLVPLGKEGATYARAALSSSTAAGTPPPPPHRTRGESFSPSNMTPGALRPPPPEVTSYSLATKDALNLAPPFPAPSSAYSLASAASQYRGTTSEADLVKSPTRQQQVQRARSPTRNLSSPPPAASLYPTGQYSYDKLVVSQNNEHRSRMSALQQLADKFARPQSITQYSAPVQRNGGSGSKTTGGPAPGGDGAEHVASHSGGQDVASARDAFSSARARQYAEQLSGLMDGEGETSRSTSADFVEVADNNRPSWRGTF